MQKFRDYIYSDETRINFYISQIPQLNKTPTSESYERTTEVEGGISAKIINAGTVLNEKTLKTYSLNTNVLETIVNWSLNAKDAINYDGNTLKKEDKDRLIVFRGKMTIPEMSENLETINSLANNTEIFNIMPMTDDDKAAMSLIKESENIPILLEVDSDYIFNCNLKKKCIIGEKDDFFDNIEDDITIIGKIDKIYNTEDNIEIYDLSKEVLKLNRAIRRKLPKETLDKALIYEKGPLVKITPIVIYK